MDDTGFGESPFRQQYQPAQSEKRSSKRIILIVVAVLLLGGGIFAATRFLGTSTSQPEKTEATPTPTEFVFPTDTPTPETSPTKEPSPTTKATPTKAPPANTIDKATGLDRAKLTVAVRNGSGTAGEAGKASDTLKGLGYTVSAIGNADNFDYVDVTIQVKSSKSNYLSLLRSDLSSSYTVGTASASLADSSSTDAVVIVGK